LSNSPNSLRIVCRLAAEKVRLRRDESAPTLCEMDISLSLRITIRSLSLCESPAWFKPSKASPAVIEPSPMTATTLAGSLFRRLAQAMPKPAEMEVLLCPVVKLS
jgi:hypothetical protein